MSLVNRRSTFFLFSGILLFLSLGSILFFGLKPSIDFTGGTRLQIQFSESVTTEETMVLFQETVGEEKRGKAMGVLEKNDILITSKTLSKEEQTQLEKAFVVQGKGGEIVQINTIGASVGNVFRKNAFISIALAVLAIILFVAYAFRSVPSGLSSWKFGLAAIGALAHDILIIVGFFAFLGFYRGTEVDTLFITALLTILGFSVNDTIVIFDRIRENLKGQKDAHLFPEITEKSLLQSFRRSINTSLSTLIVISSMLIFFVSFEDLFSFFLALALGIIVGTYSSLFVAPFLLLEWQKKK